MSTEFKGTIFLIGFIAFLFGMLAFAGNADYQNEVDTKSEFCKMVDIWNSKEMQKVPKVQRYGWPDSNGRYDRECK